MFNFQYASKLFSNYSTRCTYVKYFNLLFDYGSRIFLSWIVCSGHKRKSIFSTLSPCTFEIIRAATHVGIKVSQLCSVHPSLSCSGSFSVPHPTSSASRVVPRANEDDDAVTEIRINDDLFVRISLGTGAGITRLREISA